MPRWLGRSRMTDIARACMTWEGHEIEHKFAPCSTEREGVKMLHPIFSGIGKVEFKASEPAFAWRESGKPFRINHPLVHSTEIRTSISPSSAVELSTTNSLANYATKAGNILLTPKKVQITVFTLTWVVFNPPMRVSRRGTSTRSTDSERSPLFTTCSGPSVMDAAVMKIRTPHITTHVAYQTILN
ncbi:unnamed protein product [Timema podura]|uniref:Uncharacterized protein n=1 Tax=Timema podura TaxID=61482 RepID=A0ABN7PCI8_TIMPD|nr:unnamed protein product [Timema podura]